MTNLKYFCITLILAMVVAFSGSASVVAPVPEDGAGRIDKALQQQPSKRPDTSLTLSAIDVGL